MPSLNSGCTDVKRIVQWSWSEVMRIEKKWLTFEFVQYWCQRHTILYHCKLHLGPLYFFLLATDVEVPQQCQNVDIVACVIYSPFFIVILSEAVFIVMIYSTSISVYHHTLHQLCNSSWYRLRLCRGELWAVKTRNSGSNLDRSRRPFRLTVGRFQPPIQCSAGYLLWGKNGQVVNQNTHCNLLTMWRMSGVIPPLSYMALCHAQGRLYHSLLNHGFDV